MGAGASSLFVLPLKKRSRNENIGFFLFSKRWLMHEAEDGAGALGQSPVVDGHQAKLNARRAGVGAASKKQALRHFHLEVEDDQRKHEGVVHDKFL